MSMKTSQEGLRIGFLTIWFERGQAYVTKAMRDAIARCHETFVFARTGYTGDEEHLKTTGAWAVPNLTTYPEYLIPHDIFRSWIVENQLNIMIFNEERQRSLIEVAKSCQVKTVEYIAWELFDISALSTYTLHDRILCPTRACYDHLKALGFSNLEHITWGIDLTIFKPSQKAREGKIRFFHPAGWQVHPRRGTEFVLDAFRKMRKRAQAELVIHTQSPLNGISDEDIHVIHGTFSSQDEVAELYRDADVAVLPSKWEGLGLTFPESLACGLPVITVDAPPMNEFVRDWYNGFCCRVAEVVRYPGLYIHGVHVDVDDLTEKMDTLMDRQLLTRMRETAIRDAQKSYDWAKNGDHLLRMLDGIYVKDTQKSSITLPRLTLVRKSYSDCELVTEENIQYIESGNTREKLTIHLVGARWSNFPWGMENEIYRTLEKMGIDIIDTDYRRDPHRIQELFAQEAHIMLVVKGAGIPPALICQQKGPTVLWYPDDVFATDHARQHIAYNGWVFDTVYSFDPHAME
ncbi:MAG: glycosyltransferase family 4 protein, partial [Candidatus Latescibacteria bacterium]|nr:glycosyltransferase family 4 protein [Candidatus Latescibacterota bacterium]